MSSLTEIRQSVRDSGRRFLDILPTQQYVNPHEPIGVAFVRIGMGSGAGDLPARMGLAPTTALGRLTRHDLERASRLAGMAQVGRRFSR